MVFDIFFDDTFFVFFWGVGFNSELKFPFILSAKSIETVQKLNTYPHQVKHQYKRHEERTNNKYNRISEVLLITK